MKSAASDRPPLELLREGPRPRDRTLANRALATHALQSQRCHLQAGDPALGAGLQRGDVCRGQVQTHRLVEELSRLGGSEAQVGRAQLGQLVSSAQPGQRQVGILAGGDDQVHLRRQSAPDMKARASSTGLAVDHVIVVENEDETVCERQQPH